jgi:fumarylacetoacetase
VNQLAALPKNEQKILRLKVQNALSQAEVPSNCKSHISEATLYLPVDVRGFTDFSCTKDHLLNASNILFKKANLPPGFLHFPIGYTGRASSIVVSGTPITRPKGQFRNGKDVVFGPSKQLDYELELGCIVGKPTTFGDTVSIEDADEHVFGLVLINDWSGKEISVKCVEYILSYYKHETF